MKLSNSNIGSLLLIISFVVQREITSIEINTPILLLITVILIIVNNGRILKPDYELLFLLVIIIFIGIFVSAFNKPDFYNFFRDLLYFTRPIILILLGYFIARKIKSWKTIFRTLIYLGVGYAVYHIVHTLIYTDFKTATIASIRRINRLSNIIELFAIALILIGNKYSNFNVISKKCTKIFFLTILATSIMFYFSRTMFVGLFFLVLGVLNYLKLNKKGLKYSGFLILFFISLYVYLYNTDIDRKGNNIESFLYKIKIAPTEIFSPKFDINDHAQLWDHWRAYETYCAFNSLNKKPVNYIYGNGFGALFDLKIYVPLSSEGKVRYVPSIHNGYVYVLYKTGVLGLFFYLLFLFYMYFQAYFHKKNIENLIFSNLLSSTSLYLLFSSLIIAGLYNTEEAIAIFLGVFMFLNSNAKNNANKLEEY